MKISFINVFIWVVWKEALLTYLFALYEMKFINLFICIVWKEASLTYLFALCNTNLPAILRIILQRVSDGSYFLIPWTLTNYLKSLFDVNNYWCLYAPNKRRECFSTRIIQMSWKIESIASNLYSFQPPLRTKCSYSEFCLFVFS